ncbi:MAG: penicillin-binding protein 2 [Rickettsiales bacterium]|jgi:cell division protein FtsI (penicillin-binding protein 3)|nr:penicillin-binding protein 2 [Rickettsiales bacterium]
MTPRDIKILLMMTILSLLFALILGRMFIFSIVQYNYPTAGKNILSGDRIKRRSIVDRNYNLIAGDVETKTLYINGDLLEDESLVAEKLSKIIGLDRRQIHSKLTNRNTKSRYILIKRHIFPEEESKIRQLPIASVVFENSLLRYYPHDNLFSHAVGYVNVDGRGMLGLEEYYDEYLKNASGDHLRTTLDIRIQSVLREELQRAKEFYRANFVVGIVGDIDTGNILATVSLPDFNPNDPNDRLNTFNHASYGNYELGSILKVFTIANGLELGLIGENSRFDVTRDIGHGKFLIGDIDSIRNRETLSTGEVLALSSNIGIALIAKKIGIGRQLEFFESIGMLEKLDTDIRQVSLPIQPRKWKDINLMTIAYGYGVAVSPLHALSALGGIVGGAVVAPRFSYGFRPQRKVRKISKKTSELIRKFLRLVVTGGTGRLAHIDGYDIGGKTGTARKMSVGGYQKGAHLASFFGAWPIGNPRYSIIIVIDRPKEPSRKDADGTGGSVAAPIAKDIILKITPFLEMEPIK